METIEILLIVANFLWYAVFLCWMIWGILIFFPNIRRDLLQLIEKKIVYKKHTLGSNTRQAWQKELIRKNQNLLSANQVPINKIRFVFQPCFQYDIDADKINPMYNIMIPIYTDTGLFVKDSPIIEVGKPLNMMTISVGNYQMADNYAYLKETLKRSKLGIVIFIVDETVPDFETNEPMPYKFSVDDEVIRFAVLDDAVAHYKNT
jgi:hypothetical protein